MIFPWFYFSHILFVFDPPEIVVNQHYITEAENEYIIRGNSAILKCKIPSFIADFVFIDAWIDDSGVEYQLSTNDDDGG